jgi:hypothetical protein
MSISPEDLAELHRLESEWGQLANKANASLAYFRQRLSEIWTKYELVQGADQVLNDGTIVRAMKAQ